MTFSAMPLSYSVAIPCHTRRSSLRSTTRRPALSSATSMGRFSWPTPHSRRCSVHPGELAGKSVELLVPEAIRAAHRRYRAGFAVDPVTRPMGGREVEGRRKDGSRLPLEVGLVATTGEGGQWRWPRWSTCAPDGNWKRAWPRCRRGRPRSSARWPTSPGGSRPRRSRNRRGHRREPARAGRRARPGSKFVVAARRRVEGLRADAPLGQGWRSRVAARQLSASARFPYMVSEAIERRTRLVHLAGRRFRTRSIARPSRRSARSRTCPFRWSRTKRCSASSRLPRCGASTPGQRRRSIGSG